MMRLIGYKPSRLSSELGRRVIHQNFILVLQPEVKRVIAPSTYATATEALASIQAVANAAGFGDMRAHEYPRIGREIRVWLWSSDLIPFHVFRLTKIHGTMSGEHISYTREQDRRKDMGMGDFYFVSPASTCRVSNVRDIELCRDQRSTDINWTGVWSALEHAGIWTLPDESALNRKNESRVDPYYLIVELWNGQHYSSRVFERQSVPGTQESREVQQMRDVLTQLP